MSQLRSGTSTQEAYTISAHLMLTHRREAIQVTSVSDLRNEEQSYCETVLSPSDGESFTMLLRLAPRTKKSVSDVCVLSRTAFAFLCADILLSNP